MIKLSNKLSTKAKTILATLASFVIGSSIIVQCSNGANIRWEPGAIATADSAVE